MELLSIIASLVGISEGIASIREKLRDDSDRTYFAEWLSKTSILLSGVADTLKRGEYPHTACSNMLYSLKHMYHIMEKHMDTDKAQELYRMIGEAHQVERLCGELDSCSAEQRDFNLNKLYEAAGAFGAAADYVLMK